MSSSPRAPSFSAGELVAQDQRRPPAGHCRRLWEGLWGGVSNWARTPTGFYRPAGAPLRPPVIDGIEELDQDSENDSIANSLG